MSHKVLIFKQIIIPILVLFLFIGISNQSYAADITNTKVEQKEYESKNIDIGQYDQATFNTGRGKTWA